MCSAKGPSQPARMLLCCVTQHHASLHHNPHAAGWGGRCVFKRSELQPPTAAAPQQRSITWRRRQTAARPLSTPRRSRRLRGGRIGCVALQAHANSCPDRSLQPAAESRREGVGCARDPTQTHPTHGEAVTFVHVVATSKSIIFLPPQATHIPPQAKMSADKGGKVEKSFMVDFLMVSAYLSPTTRAAP